MIKGESSYVSNFLASYKSASWSIYDFEIMLGWLGASLYAKIILFGIFLWNIIVFIAEMLLNVLRMWS